MKKILSMLLAAALTASVALPVSAARVTGREAVEQLETLGLARGDGEGFAPERGATRAEAAVMLLRLLGRESAAEKAGLPSRFTDGGWADAYLSYAYDAGLVRGVSDDTFDSAGPVSARDYLTMALRALGYAEGEDFTWATSAAFADAIGLTHGEYAGEEEFLREDLALVSYTALTLRMKGSALRLIDRLYLDGAVDGAALKGSRLANAVNAGRQVYSAAELHEMAASAVLYIEVYKTREDFEAGTPSSNGSGFLISPDGLAVLCYHQLEDCAAARVTTSDGRLFDIERVLAYDPLWDYALVRLSETDTEGNSVRFFPYLDLGDSRSISTGDTVYTVSNPLGMIDTVTSGLVSHPDRNVDDPDYRCIQITAPISSGSSGGPLFNVNGDVIGILYASFTRGQNMNLAIPINALQGLDRDAEGLTLEEVKTLETEKKNSAVITAEATELTLAVGEKRTVVIATDYPGSPNLRFDVGNSSVIGCAWGDFVTKQSVNLNITALQEGKSVLDISYVGVDNEDATLRLTVTVVPEETTTAEA